MLKNGNEDYHHDKFNLIYHDYHVMAYVYSLYHRFKILILQTFIQYLFFYYFIRILYLWFIPNLVITNF